MLIAKNLFRALLSATKISHYNKKKICLITLHDCKIKFIERAATSKTSKNVLYASFMTI